MAVSRSVVSSENERKLYLAVYYQVEVYDEQHTESLDLN
jgi:hypothetical protein